MHPHLPTPVARLTALETGQAALWMKDDGQLGDVYGGNKVRKLARLLAGARERNIRRVLTIGAAGSHHVLATTLCARSLDLEVSALMVPQHHTEHAERMLRCSVGHGARLLSSSSPADVLAALGLLFGRDVLRLGPGAMGVVGSSSYVSAVNELQQQIEDGTLPEPECIVVALGSGSTAAGLLVGLEQAGMRTRVIAVPAAPSRWSRYSVLVQAWRVARHCKLSTRWSRLAARLHVEAGERGQGYGVPSPAGQRALERALEVGLALDPTYTAKAFASALRLAAEQREPVLYWHTLSSRALQPLLERAPALDALSPKLRRLLR